MPGRPPGSIVFGKNKMGTVRAISFTSIRSRHEFRFNHMIGRNLALSGMYTTHGLMCGGPAPCRSNGPGE